MGQGIQALAVPLLRRRWPWGGAVAVWAGVLFLLSANSHPQTGPEFPFKDKLLHCLYFSGGAFCFVLAIFAGRVAPPTRFRGIGYGLWFAAIAGGLDEWHQSFTPGRMGNDWADWLADCSGGVLGGWLAWRFLQAFTRARSRGGRSPR